MKGVDKVGQAGAPQIDQTPAMEALAIVLFNEMNRLDSETGFWGCLTPDERDFYRSCIRAILNRKEVTLKAIADNDNICWHSEVGK